MPSIYTIHPTLFDFGRLRELKAEIRVDRCKHPLNMPINPTILRCLPMAVDSRGQSAD